MNYAQDHLAWQQRVNQEAGRKQRFEYWSGVNTEQNVYTPTHFGQEEHKFYK